MGYHWRGKVRGAAAVSGRLGFWCISPHLCWVLSLDTLYGWDDSRQSRVRWDLFLHFLLVFHVFWGPVSQSDVLALLGCPLRFFLDGVRPSYITRLDAPSFEGSDLLRNRNFFAIDNHLKDVYKCGECAGNGVPRWTAPPSVTSVLAGWFQTMPKCGRRNGPR